MSEATKTPVLYDVTYSTLGPDGQTIKDSIKIREGVSLEVGYRIGSRLADVLSLKESAWALEEGKELVEGDKYAWITIMPTDNDEWVLVAPAGETVE